MENLLFYLLKSSGLIVLFFLAYYFLLRKETFFRSNRWFLLLGLLTSVVLPLITFEKIIWVEASPKLYTWNNNLPIAAAPVTETLEINWYLVLASVYVIGLLVLLFQF